jgi:hypothetical protein
MAARTATAVSGAVQRRQARRDAEAQAYQEAQAAEAYRPQQPSGYVPSSPVDVTPTQDDRIARLERLAQLKTQGVLTEEEFAAEKAAILRR